MYLESLCFDLLFPIVIMDLNIVENSIHQYSDVWILVGK